MRLLVWVFSLCIIFTALILAAGCTGTTVENNTNSSSAAADQLYSQAKAEFEAGNYSTASSLFDEAQNAYLDSGDSEKALAARNGGFLAVRATIADFTLNLSEAETDMKERVPGITDKEIDDWLSNSAQKIKSDGNTLYFNDVAGNYLYNHSEILRESDTANFDYLSRYAIPGENTSGDANATDPYVNPVRYTGTEQLDLPAEILPDNGTIQIWFPLPVETESQINISVENLSYPEYIVNGPVTTGKIGYVYYEIPLDKISGNLSINADIGFTSYEQIFDVDPAKVEAYNTSDPEYIEYTGSERNIEINDEIRQKAEEIAGNETNPYLQAQMIYDYIITTYPYSHFPHCYLDTVIPKTAESTYMFETGHGDCGTQSMLFSAMCRALGIPARATGGYQVLDSDTPGTHFWAEYYIEGYGWIPCDPTIAEASDWVDISDGDREAFKEYYSSNLDPARYVIQKNVDAEMSPEIPEDEPVIRFVRQNPAIVCDTSDIDLDLYGSEYFSIELKAGN